MKAIKLTQGKVAWVSDSDFKAVSAYPWQAHQNQCGKWYAKRKFAMPDGSRKTIFMHRWIMGPPPNLWVDHMDGDGLMNTRENLRNVTPKQNAQNIQPQDKKTAECFL